MDNSALFRSYHLFSQSWEAVFLIVILLILLGLVIALLKTTPQEISSEYRADRAWIHAGIFFCTCFIISWSMRVLHTIVNTAFISIENITNLNWIIFTILCILIEVIAYYIIWAKGTVTHGRPLVLSAVIPFGLLWGISQGLLFLCFWALFERFIVSKFIIVIVTFIACSGFQGLWHSQYWDIHVSPEHNIVEWNSKKVLFAHIPNLLITLPYLAIWGNAGFFVLFQIIALVGSTYFMHFPPFWNTKPTFRGGT